MNYAIFKNELRNLYGYEKELNKVKPGEFTSKIISMDGRQFYKPKEI